MQFVFVNILVAIFNGFVSGYNAAILATGNSTNPALTVMMIAANGGAAVWLAKITFDRAKNAQP